VSPFSDLSSPPTTSTLTFKLRSSDEGTDPKLKNFSSWSFVALDLWLKPVENVGGMEVGDLNAKVGNFVRSQQAG